MAGIELNLQEAEKVKVYKRSKIKVVLTGFCDICGFSKSVSTTRKFGYAVFIDGTNNLKSFAIPNATHGAIGQCKIKLDKKHSKKCYGSLNYLR